MATAPAAEEATANFGFGTPFEEQLAFFRRKLNLPTEKWDDIMRAAHDRAFIVAGAAKADLLQDLRGAVDGSIAGGSLGEFRQQFKTIVAKHGWTGWRGEGSAKGEAWRTRIIHQTNMATSYAAGRRAQMTEPDSLAERPFWRYVHADGVLHPRPLHLAWHNLVLPADHEFWKTHFAPNGWGCRCEVWPVKGPREGDATEPPKGWDELDPRTGAPVGIDRGFDYAPGAHEKTPLRQMVQDKLITYPDAMAQAMVRDLGKYLAPAEKASEYAAQVLADRSPTLPPMWLGFVEQWQAIKELTGQDVKGFVLLLPNDAPRHAHDAHQFDGRDQRALTPEDWNRLLQVLNAPDRLAQGEGASDNVRFVAFKQFGDETVRVVFEVRPGKRNRAVVPVTMTVKLKPAKRKRTTQP